MKTDPIQALLAYNVCVLHCCNGLETQVNVLATDNSTSIGASVEFKQIAEDGRVSSFLCPTALSTMELDCLCQGVMWTSPTAVQMPSHPLGVLLTPGHARPVEIGVVCHLHLTNLTRLGMHTEVNISA